MSNLELHYYLDNNLHSMDAFVKNKSEAELLKLFTEITNLLDIEVDLEIEAIREGGIREVFKILKKKKSKNLLSKY